MTAAVGLLCTLGSIEAILVELQTYVDEHVPRLSEAEPWPEYGVQRRGSASRGSVLRVRQLPYLAANVRRAPRPSVPTGIERERGPPARARHPAAPGARIQEFVEEFRRTTLERTLANYQLHAAAVTQPLEGARVSRDHRVSLPIPDRANERIASRWHLSYDDEREALPVAREAARAVESLVDDVIDAFEHESRAVEDERRQAQSP